MVSRAVGYRCKVRRVVDATDINIAPSATPSAENITPFGLFVQARSFSTLQRREQEKGGRACLERRTVSLYWSIRGFHGRGSSICSPLTFVSGTEHAPMELGPSLRPGVSGFQDRGPARGSDLETSFLAISAAR